jgi:SpoVK/Ycf46/Vps4 family AAA+-type ATPase
LTDAQIQNVFLKAKENKNAIIVFDDLERMFPSKQQA